MGTYNDRPTVAEAFYKTSYLNYFAGIKSCGRLIKYQYVRIPYQRLGYAHTLLVSLGKILYQPMINLLYPNNGTDLRYMRFPVAYIGFFCAFFQVIHEVQIVPDGHVMIQRRNFRQISDLFLGLSGLFEDIVAVYPDGAAGRGGIARHHIHSRTLPRSVRAEKSDYLPFLHSKGHIIDHRAGSVSLCQTANF